MVSAVITRDRLFFQFLLYHHLPLQFAFFIKGLLKTVGFFFDTYLASYSQTDRHLSIFTSNSFFVCFFSNIFEIILILNFLNFTLYYICLLWILKTVRTLEILFLKSIRWVYLHSSCFVCSQVLWTCWALKNWMFISKITSGSRLKSSLPKSKMANNKRHRTILDVVCFAFQQGVFLAVLFWDNA